MLDLTLGPSFKVKRWFTGFGELSFRWIQINLHRSPMHRSSYICYVQVETLYKLHVVQRACTSCKLYKQFAQVATCTRLAVQVVTCMYIISPSNNPTSTILLYKVDLKRILFKLTMSY